ncbi:MAG: hypothetical protein K2W94_07735 [Alphaproteobacteria bacterium]|nr:hypothetical protein [Alphaproteobacteria bacterium]
MKRLYFVAAVCVAVLLAACSGTPERNYCPRFSLISELDRVPVTTTKTLQGEIRVTQIAARCDDDSMELALQTRLALTLNDETVVEKEIPYFVAVIDDKENVINRQDFVFKAKLKGPEETKIYKQSYKMPSGFDWKTMRILVGLKLTPEQRQQNMLVKAQQQSLMNADMNTQQTEKVKKLSVG